MDEVFPDANELHCLYYSPIDGLAEEENLVDSKSVYYTLFSHEDQREFKTRVQTNSQSCF